MRPREFVFSIPTVDVASDIAPVVPLIVSALVVVVDVPLTVVVERYRFPPAFRNVHCASPPPDESESCGAVDDARVSEEIRYPVVVPTARLDDVAE